MYRQLRRAGVRAFNRLYALTRGNESLKQFHELRYWKGRHAQEKNLRSDDWYMTNYTTRFGLDPSFYEGKKILDVGCGPRGSLEWAGMAAERVGLDPLADKYQELGAKDHAMSYVCAHSESIPFEDGHFDVVMSMNSLDHVADVDRTVAELVRVVRPGGTILLLTSIDHEPTPTEPHSFGMDVLDKFRGCETVWMERLERPEGEWRWDIPFDQNDPTPRMSGIAARLEKLAASA